MGSTANKGLAAAMEAAGPACTTSEATFVELVQAHGPVTEDAAAEVLALLVRRSEGLYSSEVSPSPGGLAGVQLGDGAASYAVHTAAAGLCAAAPSLDWRAVAAALDRPGFGVPDAGGLKVLMVTWAHATPEPFPLLALVGGVWANAAGQLSLLRHATAAPPELFPWAHAPRRLEPLEGLHAGKSPTGTPNQAWVCLDLYACLAALACAGHAPDVRRLLEHPLKHCPEVLLLGLAGVPTGWGPLQAEVRGRPRCCARVAVAARACIHLVGAVVMDATQGVFGMRAGPRTRPAAAPVLALGPGP